MRAGWSHGSTCHNDKPGLGGNDEGDMEKATKCEEWGGTSHNGKPGLCDEKGR